MKISELMEQLEQAKEVHGDIEVSLYTDHGQTNSIAYSVGIQILESIDSRETLHPDDYDDLDDEYKSECVHTLEIYGD